LRRLLTVRGARRSAVLESNRFMEFPLFGERIHIGLT
jgi:hypothetical protein